jgi:hypothetical protein
VVNGAELGDVVVRTTHRVHRLDEGPHTLAALVQRAAG